MGFIINCTASTIDTSCTSRVSTGCTNIITDSRVCITLIKGSTDSTVRTDTTDCTASRGSTIDCTGVTGTMVSVMGNVIADTTILSVSRVCIIMSGVNPSEGVCTPCKGLYPSSRVLPLVKGVTLNNSGFTDSKGIMGYNTNSRVSGVNSANSSGGEIN